MHPLEIVVTFETHMLLSFRVPVLNHHLFVDNLHDIPLSIFNVLIENVIVAMHDGFP